MIDQMAWVTDWGWWEWWLEVELDWDHFQPFTSTTLKGRRNETYSSPGGGESSSGGGGEEQCHESYLDWAVEGRAQTDQVVSSHQDEKSHPPCHLDTSLGPIRLSWVTWRKVYDFEKPETPDDSRNITDEVSRSIGRYICTTDYLIEDANK